MSFRSVGSDIGLESMRGSFWEALVSLRPSEGNALCPGHGEAWQAQLPRGPQSLWLLLIPHRLRLAQGFLGYLQLQSDSWASLFLSLPVVT